MLGINQHVVDRHGGREFEKRSDTGTVSIFERRPTLERFTPDVGLRRNLATEE